MDKPSERKNPKKTGRLVSRFFLILLISVFFGVTVYSVNARRVLHNEMPMPFGFGLSVVLSGSMEPTLSVNDLVAVVSAEEYRTGDVVVYQDGGDLIIHRIVWISEDQFVTQGDANDTADAPFPLTAIKGKMAFHVPFMGLPVRLVQTTLGKLLVIAAAFLLLLRSWRRERTQTVEAQEAIKDEIRRLRQELQSASDSNIEQEPDSSQPSSTQP